MKAGGTYPAIDQGVSNKEPQHRRPGQTGRQTNMLPDTVNGLVRRRGTRFAARLTVPLTSELREELRAMDVFDFIQDEKEYCLLYRRNASTNSEATFAFLYNKTDEVFIPITYENSAWVDDLVSGGASSLAAIGRYVYISGNTTIPAVTQTNLWEAPENLHRLAAWVRVGNYNNTYTVTLHREDGTTLSVEYTTVSATYPGTLDTSGIPFFEPDGTTPRPDYQKDVNDAVNAYNSAVNEWIVTAAQNITPENIAEQLSDLLVAEGVASTYINGGILIDDADFVDITVDDSEDNTIFYAAGKEITDATRVTKYHFHGKIIRVRPSGGGADESFYLQARLDSGATSGVGAVSWFEAAGVAADLTNFVAQLIIVGGNAYVAQNGAGLETLAPGSGPHPEYASRVVGDGLTSPVPWFVGKTINMLAVFQDRLVVGSENYANASRSGDYLNFWRQSVLTIADEDPVEVFAHGSEGDVLRHAMLYNGNLIIFGENQQYGISGDVMLTARSPLIKQFSANKDSTDAKAKISGNFIFYSQYGTEGLGLHQMRVGALNGQQTVTDELSEELDSEFLVGIPLQIVPLTSPNYIMFRTTSSPSQVYLYKYEDNKNNGQRTQAAWTDLQYNPALGTIIGVSSHKKTGIVFTARAGSVVADVLDFKAKLDTHGYMDSRIAYSSRANADVADSSAVAVVNSLLPQSFLLGTPMTLIEEFLEQLPEAEPYLEYGVVSDGVVRPTNPFPRDQNGQAVLDGRMSLNRVTVDVYDTAGMVGTVTTKSGTITSTDFEGRILGDSDNLLDTQPIYNGELTLPVGREVRECYYEIHTKTWLPLHITGLAWTGQTFNNVRRVS